MAIEVNHKGYIIRFNENADEWACSEAGYYSSASLAKVRARIDKMLLDERKASSIKAFELKGGRYSRPELIEATVIAFISSKEEKDYRGNPTGIRHTVASVARRDKNDKASRKELNLRELVPDRPDVHAAFATYVEAYKAAAEAEKHATKLFDAIPRLDLSDIASLVDIASREEGGD